MKKYLTVLTVAAFILCVIIITAFKNTDDETPAKYVIVTYSTAFRELVIFRGDGVMEKVKVPFNLMQDPAKLELVKVLEKLGAERYEIISVNTHNTQAFTDSALGIEYVYTLALK
ncbi:MAG: hypothetical protein O9262_09180 [Cyclobacteriaceae bacterium]|nr:hypothetical protein [Cyclobacteriaceae bacterium]